MGQQKYPTSWLRPFRVPRVSLHIHPLSGRVQHIMLQYYGLRVVPDEENDVRTATSQERPMPRLRALAPEADVDEWLSRRKVGAL